MSSNNPSITVSDIVTDVENRLNQPSLGGDVYLPWVSYAYAKTYAALANAGQGVKEALFGAYMPVALVNGQTEYTLSSLIPRFASVIKIEVLYGASGDQRNTASKIKSIAHIKNMGQLSTTYWSKTQPFYYQLEDTLGVIPTPDGGTMYVWYIKRPYQLTSSSDVIDIDYRFIYPIVNFVQAKAIQAVNEDYTTSEEVERIFERELEQIANTAAGEYNEEEGDSVQISSSSSLYENPLDY